jgi:predicted transcriptional regulator
VLEALAPKMDRKRVKIAGETVQETVERLAKALVQEGVVGR